MFTDTLIDVKNNKIIDLLNSWLLINISPEALTWLQDKQQEVRESAELRKLFTAFSFVSRCLETQKLNLSSEELNTANNLITGWNPQDWMVDQIARTLLILSFPHQNEDKYVATLDKIFAAADVREAIALYQSLPLLPYPERFKLRAAEGVRSNMTSVFNAVALNNPYPAQYLDDLAWNQMVLKALFVGSPLQPIYGLNQRNNEQLCQMLIDYARERLAAKRTVNSELWQLVAPFNPQVANSLETEFKVVCC
ncbi:MAG: EboA domain-containing protein [Pleurocapsa sp.]